MRRNNIILGLVILVLIVVGIFYFNSGSTRNGNSENATKSARENIVEVKNYAFSPQKIKVKKGTTITWENFDLVPHTVTMSDKDKAGPNSELFGKGKKYSYTFSKPGIYEYYCTPHPYMKGSVEVTD